MRRIDFDDAYKIVSTNARCTCCGIPLAKGTAVVHFRMDQYPNKHLNICYDCAFLIGRGL